MSEDVLHAEATAAESATKAAGTSAEALRTHGMAELVILLPLLRITQYIVSFGSFLEFLLGFLITRIAVRMILYRLLAVCLLYFVGSSGLRYAKYFIIISLVCHFPVFRLRSPET